MMVDDIVRRFVRVRKHEVVMCCEDWSLEDAGHAFAGSAADAGAPPYFCSACQREFKRTDLQGEQLRESLDGQPVVVETLACPGCGALLAVDLDFLAA